MKSKIVLLVMLFATAACNSGSSTKSKPNADIYGSWYAPYSEESNGHFSPELLMTISEDGTVLMATTTTKQKDKEVEKAKAELTGESITVLETIASTKCRGSGASSNNVANYQLSGNQLTLTFGKVKLTLTRATTEQIKKFEDLKEGCN